MIQLETTSFRYCSNWNATIISIHYFNRSNLQVSKPWNCCGSGICQVDLLKDVVTWKASQHFDHVLAMETCRPMPETTDETVEPYSVLMEKKVQGSSYVRRKHTLCIMRGINSTQYKTLKLEELSKFPQEVFEKWTSSNQWFQLRKCPTRVATYNKRIVWSIFHLWWTFRNSPF